MKAALAADVGGTKMAIGAVDAEHRVRHSRVEPTRGLGADELVARLTAGLIEARDAEPTVGAVGLGLPCAIDHDRGEAVSAVNLPISRVPIRDYLVEQLGLPVYLDNDANLAAFAEQRAGAARGARHVVMLTVGTGIGGGVIVDGRVYRGGSGSGAELGHMVIADGGPDCQGTCPNRGCLEAMASGTALAREARASAEANPDSRLGRLLAAGAGIDGPAVVQAAVAGDSLALRLVELAGERLGAGLSSLANIFAPEVFVVGGGVTGGAGELLLQPARRELRSRALRPNGETPVLAAELGPAAGLVGAALLAMDDGAGASA